MLAYNGMVGYSWHERNLVKTMICLQERANNICLWEVMEHKRKTSKYVGKNTYGWKVH